VGRRGMNFSEGKEATSLQNSKKEKIKNKRCKTVIIKIPKEKAVPPFARVEENKGQPDSVLRRGQGGRAGGLFRMLTS